MFAIDANDETVIIAALYEKGTGGQAEIPNPKQYPNLNAPNPKRYRSHVPVSGWFGNWFLGHWNLLGAWSLQFGISSRRDGDKWVSLISP